MEWPKRVRTSDWASSIPTLDGEKTFEIPELTMAFMERLAGYTLVSFHVKGYPVTDDLLSPFAGHKSMANFGVEEGALTDACFPVFSLCPSALSAVGRQRRHPRQRPVRLVSLHKDVSLCAEWSMNPILPIVPTAPSPSASR